MIRHRLFETMQKSKLILILLAVLPLAYFSYLNRNFQLDDGLIYQRYVRNFLEGRGLVYNPGEYFNALTSPLFSYLNIALSYLTGDTQIAAMLSSTVAMGCALVALYAVFQRYEQSSFLIVGAVLMVCLPYFYRTYGMESTLFIALLAACMYFFEQHNCFRLGIACALLLLTRGEGIFMILALSIEHFRRGRAFPALGYFVLPALILGSSYLFNKLYYGNFLPHTAGAKIAHGQSGLWGERLAFASIAYHYAWFFGRESLLVLGILILAVGGFVRLYGTGLNRIIGIFLLAYTAFYLSLNIPNYHWYYAPYYAFGSFYAGAGAALIAQRITRLNSGVWRNSVRLLAVALLLVLVQRAGWITHTALAHSGPPPHYQRIALWLRGNTPTDAKIALAEIGTVGFYSERYIIDILGLTNPLNADFIAAGRLDEWLNHYSPDYVLMHQPLRRYEFGIKTALECGSLVEDERFAFAGFKLYRRASSRLQCAIYHPRVVGSLKTNSPIAYSLSGCSFSAHCSEVITCAIPFSV